MRSTRRGVLAGAGALAVTASGSVGSADAAGPLTATEAVARIRSGDLSTEAYVAQLLDRCRRSSDLHALVSIAGDDARAAGKEIDRRRSQGQSLPPLAGLPLVVKDNIDVAGMANSGGTPGLRHFVPAADAPVVARLRSHGAIVIAKANLHELAAGVTSSNRTFGAVENPFDRHRIPGGSSGGSACAIAAGLAPAALGTDTGGSVRIPSAYCGTVGLRPSAFGKDRLYSAVGVVPLSQTLDTIGPMGRTAADVVLLHEAISGRRVPSPGPLAGLRLGLPSQYWADVDPQVAKLGQEAIGRLRDAGIVFVELDLAAVTALSRQILDLAMGTTLSDLRAFLHGQAPQQDLAAIYSEVKGSDVKALLARSRPLDAAELFSRHRLAVESYRAAFKQAGVAAILFPTVAAPAPLIAKEGDAPGDTIMMNGRAIDKVGIIARNTVIAPTLGAPGLSLPMGLDDHGVPLGIELDGLPGGDEALLAIGQAIEPVLPRLQI